MLNRCWDSVHSFVPKLRITTSATTGWPVVAPGFQNGKPTRSSICIVAPRRAGVNVPTDAFGVTALTLRSPTYSLPRYTIRVVPTDRPESDPMSTWASPSDDATVVTLP